MNTNDPMNTSTTEDIGNFKARYIGSENMKLYTQDSIMPMYSYLEEAYNLREKTIFDLCMVQASKVEDYMIESISKITLKHFNDVKCKIGYYPTSCVIDGIKSIEYTSVKDGHVHIVFSLVPYANFLSYYSKKHTEIIDRTMADMDIDNFCDYAVWDTLLALPLDGSFVKNTLFKVIFPTIKV